MFGLHSFIPYQEPVRNSQVEDRSSAIGGRLLATGGYDGNCSSNGQRVGFRASGLRTIGFNSDLGFGLFLEGLLLM